jgi:hypothetical protein
LARSKRRADDDTKEFFNRLTSLIGNCLNSLIGNYLKTLTNPNRGPYKLAKCGKESLFLLRCAAKTLAQDPTERLFGQSL